MPALGSTELFNLINWLCILVTPFPSETQRLNGKQNLCREVGMNSIYSQKKPQLISDKIHHTYICCTCSSAILKTIFSIKIGIGRTNTLHNHFLHQVNEKKYPLQESAQKNSRSFASCTLSHCTQEEDRNKNYKVKSLSMQIQSIDPWREHSSVESHYSKGFQLYLSANKKIHGT